MDEQRKLRNLLAYTKMDSVEELEDCNKLYEELLAYINKVEKITELLGFFKEREKLVMVIPRTLTLQTLNNIIKRKEKELGEMK